MTPLRRTLTGLIATGTLCAGTFKATQYHYKNYYTNIYPNRIDDEHNTVSKYKNHKLIELNKYRYRYSDELDTLTKYDNQGNIATITSYDDKQVTKQQEYKDGQLFKRTIYDKLGNIMYIDEFTGGYQSKHTTYDNGKIKNIQTYNQCGYYTSLTDYNNKGEIDREIKYDITHNSKTVVTKLLDTKGRDCVLDKGEITVWKSGIIEDEKCNRIPVKIKLLVPEDAKRLTTPNNTSRVSKARILKITDKYGTKHNFIKCVDGTRYLVNETLSCDKFDETGYDYGEGIKVSKFKN